MVDAHILHQKRLLIGCLEMKSTIMDMQAKNPGATDLQMVFLMQRAPIWFIIYNQRMLQHLEYSFHR